MASGVGEVIDKEKLAEWEYTIRVELDIKIKWARVESVKLVGQKNIRSYRASLRESEDGK